MARTQGMDHLGLAVADLDAASAFFTGTLGWEETARDEGYPRATVTDGAVRLTLWQVAPGGAPFDRKRNVGLHHLALRVGTRDELDALHEAIGAHPECKVEFAPEPMGTGPRHHMMFAGPGGLRLELLWSP